MKKIERFDLVFSGGKETTLLATGNYMILHVAGIDRTPDGIKVRMFVEQDSAHPMVKHTLRCFGMHEEIVGWKFIKEFQYQDALFFIYANS